MKKKIFSLLIVLTMFFGFAFINVQAQAEFIDDKFIISNSINDYNEEDVKELLSFFEDYVETYNIPVNEDIFYNLNQTLYNGLNISFNADLPSLDYNLVFLKGEMDGQSGLGLRMVDYQYNEIFLIGWFTEIDVVAVVGDEALFDYNVVITYPEWITPPEPPFTGFINFIKNLLQDLLKNITDMTMDLINNIWDTNLIDINFVILSDTAIFTGTLNDMLYSVFSIFYVLFAITLVWRILRKVIRKLTFSERW